MAMVNLIQSPNSNPSRTNSLNITKVSNNHAWDLSFSSYLNPTEHASVHKLVQPGRSLSFNAEPEVEHPYYLGCKVEDGGIGVFEAEKYFNGKIDHEESLKSIMLSKKPIHFEQKKDESERGRDIVIEPLRSRVQMGTPSCHSDLTMNSQSVLLGNIVRNQSQKRVRKINGSRSLLALMGCKCSCSDKGSVDVVDDENITNFSSSLNAKSSVDGVFPNHNTSSTSDPWVAEEIQTNKSGMLGNFAEKTLSKRSSLKLNNEEAEPRKSIEVFGSPLFGVEGNNEETFNLERRLTMLNTWKVNPRKESGSEVLNETESDASSDLFEIESLTGKVNSYIMRETSDAMSGCLTPTKACYAPSEASIEWSVVTASAADFSVLSDYEEVVSGKLASTKCSGRANNGTGEVPERWPRVGILLGCKSQKAVQVAGAAHKVTNERFRLDQRMSSGHRSDLTANPVARFQADSRFITNMGSNRHI